jgi:hypothetical protein
MNFARGHAGKLRHRQGEVNGLVPFFERTVRYQFCPRLPDICAEGIEAGTWTLSGTNIKSKVSGFAGEVLTGFQAAPWYPIAIELETDG